MQEGSLVRRGVVREGLRSFIKRKILGRPPIPPDGLSTLEESTVWTSDELAAVGGGEDGEAPIPPEGMSALDGDVVWAAEAGGGGGSMISGASDRTAAELYDRFEAEQTRLNDWPDDRQCQRRCADALCAYMRLSTEGQTVTIDGPNDPPAFRAVWRTNVSLAPPQLKPFPAYFFLCSRISAGPLLSFRLTFNKIERTNERTNERTK